MRVNLLQNVVDARSKVTSRPIQGRLVAGIGRKALNRARTWRRLLSDHGEGDADWDWARFVSEMSRVRKAGLGGYRSYRLWALEDLQGLMILDIGGIRHRTRAENMPQAYVEYLSVSPDNRPNIREPRSIVGCGSALIAVARGESVLRGWQGRLGLHSLDGAILFYRSQGFMDLGADAAEAGLHYMEFSGTV